MHETFLEFDDEQIAVAHQTIQLIADKLTREYILKAGVLRPGVHVGFTGIASAFEWIITFTGDRDSQYFHGDTLSDVLNAVRRWLAHDQVADINETLGLTRDGRFTKEVA